MKTQINRELTIALEYSIGYHGFWLKNNVEHIEDDLLTAIENKGMHTVMALLDDWRGPFCKNLYKKIRTARDSKGTF